MPFRQATGRETCNDCRKKLDLGAPVYVGDITGMKWCEACAAEMGRTVDGPVPRVTALGGMAGIREGLEALARKYRFTPPPSWNERGEE
jgi:tRNA G26 N,N-dimethylase Trm1